MYFAHKRGDTYERQACIGHGGKRERRGSWRGLRRRQPSRAGAASRVRGFAVPDRSGVCGFRGSRNGAATHGAKAKGRLCRLGAGAFAFALTLCIGSVAYAFSAGVFSSSSNGIAGTKAYMINAWNRYDAAAYALGYSQSEVGAWDLPVRSKLSNASSGGAFYELVQKVETYGATLGDYPSWANSYWGSAFIMSWGSMSVGGPGCYFLHATNQEIVSAKEDLRVVLGGGSLGGGGGVEIEGTTLVFSGYIHKVASTSSSPQIVYRGSMSSSGDNYDDKYTNYVYSATTESAPQDGTARDGYTAINDVCTYRVNVTEALLNRYPVTTYDYYLSVSTLSRYTIKIYEKGKYTVSRSHNNINLANYSNTYEYISSLQGDGSAMATVSISNVGGLTYSADASGCTYEWVFTDESAGGGLFKVQSGTSSSATNGGWLGYIPLASQGGGGGLPNNWPETDPNPTPQPPEVPEPDPPTPTPEPDPPVEPNPPVTPQPPVNPPYVYSPIVTTPEPEPTNTTATDYTPWLRAILRQLNKIGSDVVSGFNAVNTALATHCEHLQDAIGDWVQWLERSIAVISNNERLSLQSYLDYLFENLHINLADELYDAIYHLELYMKEQLEWLAEQFDFSFTGYDDSSVVSWLRNIYSKLEFGTWRNPVGTPTDKDIENDFDWWSWLIDTLVKLLGDGFSDGVDTLVGILEEMQGLFPFSIPWDLVAVFGAIVADPLTPEFDIVIPAISGWWDAVTIHVDLSPYDGAASVVRAMWLVWFAVVLIMRTDWLVGVFETGARVATQFLDRL